MRTWMGLVALLLGGGIPLQLVHAQQAAAPEPIVQVTVDPARVVVGQYVTLRILVLAPNYMTSPPMLPGFQVRNAVTRQLQSANTNDQRDGVAYAGVRFEYAITPQEPGTYAVVDQNVRIKYAAEPPATREVSVALPPVAFEAFIPDAADLLRPFVSASSLTIAQDIKRSSDSLRAGDAVTRTITVKAEGTPAMLLPPQQFPSIPNLRLYPAEPKLEDKIDGRTDVMTSTRVDSATYMVEQSGDYALPAVDLGWWNVVSGEVEQAHLEAVPLRGIATAAAAGSASTRGWSWDGIVDLIFDNWLTILLLVTVAAGFAGFAPRVVRRITAILHGRRQAYLRSEAFAFGRLRHALRHHDAKESYFALVEWLPHLDGLQPPVTIGTFKAAADDPELDIQIEAIERELFANQRHSSHWSPRRLLRHVADARRRLRARTEIPVRKGLPRHLNPVGNVNPANTRRKPAR